MPWWIPSASSWSSSSSSSSSFLILSLMRCCLLYFPLLVTFSCLLFLFCHPLLGLLLLLIKACLAPVLSSTLFTPCARIISSVNTLITEYTTKSTPNASKETPNLNLRWWKKSNNLLSKTFSEIWIRGAEKFLTQMLFWCCLCWCLVCSTSLVFLDISRYIWWCRLFLLSFISCHPVSFYLCNTIWPTTVDLECFVDGVISTTMYLNMMSSLNKVRTIVVSLQVILCVIPLIQV